MTPRRSSVMLVLLLVGAATAGRAQDSQFGISGLGTPGRSESVRARSTAGALSLFDPLSPFGDVALADLGQLTAAAQAAAAFVHPDLVSGGVTLRTTRFPSFTVGGPVGHRIAVGGGFSTYLNRSWDVITHDTLTLRGLPEPVTDERTSDGGVTDVRLAAATRLSPRLALGFGVHALTGSTREHAYRFYADSGLYRNTRQIGEVQYDGWGFSASALFDPLPQLRVAALYRTDSRLRAKLGGIETARTDLPTTLAVGVRWALRPTARFAAAATRRNWSVAGANAYNTTDWSLGAELGGETFPLRVGVRGGQQPFGPAGQAPSEFGIALGTGKSFAEGRGRLDFGLEHVSRSDPGLKESAWTFLMGLIVRP
jgi:hypothetical protein